MENETLRKDAATATFNRPTRMLANINWKETSGVDHPANLEEGWLTMKAVGGNGSLEIEEAIMKAEQEAASNNDALVQDLQEANFASAPSAIKLAVEQLVTFLNNQTNNPPGTGNENAPQYGQPTNSGPNQNARMPNNAGPQPTANAKVKKPGFMNNLTHAIVNKFHKEVKVASYLDKAFDRFESQATSILRSSDDKVIKAQQAEDIISELQKSVTGGNISVAEQTGLAKYFADLRKNFSEALDTITGAEAVAKAIAAEDIPADEKDGIGADGKKQVGVNININKAKKQTNVVYDPEDPKNPQVAHVADVIDAYKKMADAVSTVQKSLSAIVKSLDVSDANAPLAKALAEVDAVSADSTAYRDILGKMLERVENLEKATAVSKAISGDDYGPVHKSADGKAPGTFDSVVRTAIKKGSVTLR